MSAARQPRRSLVRAALLLATLLSPAGLAACGPAGGGEPPAGVQLLVTDDFGARELAAPQPPKVAAGDTVLRLLQRNTEVETKFGGGFISAIAGQSGSIDGERSVDWFFYGNGVLSESGAAAWKLGAGDRIWWDRHRWDHASPGAVVGHFPEPMRSGSAGRYAGAQLSCGGDARACTIAQAQLEAAGVTVSTEAGAGNAAPTELIVGPWPAISDRDPALAGLERGPKQSGVFARLASDGTITALDHDGVRTGEAPRAGLIAALSRTGQSPLWVVTGPDAASVRAAAAQLSEQALARRFAVLVEDERLESLPSGVDGE